MTFAGIKNDQQRADVIAYLHTLSDNPVPLPKAQAENAPAAGGAAAASKPAENKPAEKPAEAPKAGAAPAPAPAPK
jgi:cytochrome c